MLQHEVECGADWRGAPAGASRPVCGAARHAGAPPRGVTRRACPPARASTAPPCTTSPSGHALGTGGPQSLACCYRAHPFISRSRNLFAQPPPLQQNNQKPYSQVMHTCAPSIHPTHPLLPLTSTSHDCSCSFFPSDFPSTTTHTPSFIDHAYTLLTLRVRGQMLAQYAPLPPRPTSLADPGLALLPTEQTPACHEPDLVVNQIFSPLMPQICSFWAQ